MLAWRQLLPQLVLLPQIVKVLRSGSDGLSVMAQLIRCVAVIVPLFVYLEVNHRNRYLESGLDPLNYLALALEQDFSVLAPVLSLVVQSLLLATLVPLFGGRGLNWTKVAVVILFISVIGAAYFTQRITTNQVGLVAQIAILGQNIPQLYVTYKWKKTETVSLISLFLHLIAEGMRAADSASATMDYFCVASVVLTITSIAQILRVRGGELRRRFTNKRKG